MILRKGDIAQQRSLAPGISVCRVIDALSHVAFHFGIALRGQRRQKCGLVRKMVLRCGRTDTHRLGAFAQGKVAVPLGLKQAPGRGQQRVPQIAVVIARRIFLLCVHMCDVNLTLTAAQGRRYRYV